MEENKQDKAKVVLDGLLSKFESGEIAPIIARRVIERPAGDSPRPCDGWSISNNVLLWIQGTSDARGFNQWKEVGRNVKKGAKAISILAPRLVKDENGEIPDAMKCIGFRHIPVFRLEDTEGADLPEIETPPPPPLSEVAQEWGISVRYAAFNGSRYGEYRHNEIMGTAAIILATPDEKTFFHELAHAAHDRLGKLDTASKARKEAVAELSATVLCRMYLGADWSGNCYEYLKGYSANPARLAVHVAEETVETLRLILSTASNVNMKAA